METYRITVWDNGQARTINSRASQTLLALLQDNGIFIAAVCAGRGTCGKCAVKIIKGCPPAGAHDEKTLTSHALQAGFRLACKTVVTEDMEISLTGRPDEQHSFRILNTYEIQEDTVHDLYTLADVPFTSESRSVLKRLAAIGVHNTARMQISLPLLQKCAALVNPDTSAENTLFRQDCRALTDGKRILDIFLAEHVPESSKSTNGTVTEISTKAIAYGVAIDIGTTTIAFELIDLLNGERVSAHARLNRQRTLGADVISRIQQASNGQLDTLRKIVSTDIVQGVEALLQAARILPAAVYHMAITGNTTMLHLLLGIPCYSLGQYPFTPAFTEMLEWPAISFVELFGNRFLSCEVTVLPGISAYVGADITAGILFCGGLRREKPCLLIDLGTNGEMAVFSEKRVLCTSTAAGPAFEAGNISCGTGSVPGALAKACYHPENGVYSYETIGGRPPIGICGSGVLDIVAQMVQHGLVDETGLLADDYFDEGMTIVKEANIVFTQKDVRELQLAKSAVRSGIEVLLQSSGLHYADIDKVYLAGGFGHKLNLTSAQTLGIIPAALAPKVTAVGNSALGGCTQTLTSRQAKTDIMRIAAMAEEINLSADARFNDLFMQHMMF